ncbi:MAG: metallophosphoesterase [Collinsella sp.]|nr:metallophosphoesterase [Collinsella sp.]
MATYVISDVHGHLKALDSALELVGPGDRDAVYMLGDLIDRGPDPIGVIRLMRSLTGSCVLMGNHERMMLDALVEGDEREAFVWELNGGGPTARALDALSREEAVDIVDWLLSLPLFDVVAIADVRARCISGATCEGASERRAHVLVHAGIDALDARGYLATAGFAPDDRGGFPHVPVAILRDMMGRQSAEDLLWIREGFWSIPTGLIGSDGRGPVVVAGHTPSMFLGRYASLMGGRGVDADGRGLVVEVGATFDTGGEADRICMDASAAAGAPHGRVCVMRLEDRRIWCADVEEGE